MEDDNESRTPQPPPTRVELAKKLDELKRLAEAANAANPAPWRVDHDWASELHDADGHLIGKFIYPSSASTAAFIAAANPQTILELIEAKSLAEAEIVGLREALLYAKDYGRFRLRRIKLVNLETRD